MKHAYKALIICVAIIGASIAVRIRSDMAVEPNPNYNVACMSSGSRLETALQDHYQFRKQLMDGDKQGKQYTCFFRIQDKDIMCLNPNYVRSGGNAELVKKGFTLDDPIAGGHIGKSKAASVCYFKNDAVTKTKYQMLRSRWIPENNLLQNFPGAKEGIVTTVKDAQAILDRALPGE